MQSRFITLSRGESEKADYVPLQRVLAKEFNIAPSESRQLTVKEALQFADLDTSEKQDYSLTVNSVRMSNGMDRNKILNWVE